MIIWLNANQFKLIQNQIFVFVLGNALRYFILKFWFYLLSNLLDISFSDISRHVVWDLHIKKMWYISQRQYCILYINPPHDLNP